MDQDTPREEAATTPAKPVGTALGVLALCFALSVLGRGLGESFSVFLLPISESFGWDRADVVSVYSLSALAGGLASPLIGRLFDYSGPRSVYSLGLLLFGGAFLFAANASRLWQFQLSVGISRRIRHCADRQCAEFDFARPLVRPKAADRDGRGLFRNRRRRIGAAAGLAGPDRSCRLARRLSDLRHHGATVASCRF